MFTRTISSVGTRSRKNRKASMARVSHPASPPKRDTTVTAMLTATPSRSERASGVSTRRRPARRSTTERRSGRTRPSRTDAATAAASRAAPGSAPRRAPSSSAGCRTHEARAVVDLPQRGDHRGCARVEEGALEADEVVTARELAEAGLAGREHDEPSVEIEAKQLPHLEPPVLTVARREQKRGGQRPDLVELGGHGDRQQ